MDIFNQNWTEQMKKDPLVNKLLNNTRPDEIKIKKIMRTGQVLSKKNIRKQIEKMPFTTEDYRDIMEYKKNNPLPKMKDAKVGTHYLSSTAVTKYGHRHKYKPSYNANTRPASLYNLRYATQR